LRQSLRLGLVLTFLFVLMTTHVGTGLFCLVRFNRRFLREVFLRAAIYEPRVVFFGFLSVGVNAGRGFKLVSSDLDRVLRLAKASGQLAA
jgi:hypothetical protein